MSGAGDIAGLPDIPNVKGLTILVNSLINGNRMEDVWLDK